jgi:transposase
LRKVIVHAASLSDRNAVHLVLAGLTTLFPRLRHLWVDAGYSGKGAEWVRTVLGWTVEVVKRPQRWVWLPEGARPPPLPTGFRVLKRRWVVERTFAWLGRYRRLSKDYEVLPASEEAWIYLATANLLVRRLAK